MYRSIYIYMYICIGSTCHANNTGLKIYAPQHTCKHTKIWQAATRTKLYDSSSSTLAVMTVRTYIRDNQQTVLTDIHQAKNLFWNKRRDHGHALRTFICLQWSSLVLYLTNLSLVVFSISFSLDSVKPLSKLDSLILYLTSWSLVVFSIPFSLDSCS